MSGKNTIPAGNPAPKFAMVSTDIRRDLIQPLRHFSHLRLVHFYRQAPYGDLTSQDRDDTLVRYTGPLDLYRQLKRESPQVIQNVELFALRQLPYVYAISTYARLHRIPTLAGVHISLPLRQRYGPILALLLKWALTPTLRMTRRFFYLNEGGRRNLRWLGVPEAKMQRLMYGTWGVDLQEFSPRPDGREPAWGADPVLLFVGRIHPEKGIEDLLEAFGRVVLSQPTARLVLIGDGPQRPAAEALVLQRAWREQVRFLGTVKNRDLPPYLRAATVLVSPSVRTPRWEEYVGMANLQALACGTPVVTTRSGAIPEYVPEFAGFLVPEHDPQALAEGILKLLADRDLGRRMGAAGRDHASRCCSAVQNVLRAEQEILQLIQPGQEDGQAWEAK